MAKSMDKIINLFFSVILILIGAGVTLFYQNEMSKPDLKGIIIFFSEGVFQNEEITLGKRITTYTTYIFMANQREVPVPVFDYSLCLEYNDGSVDTVQAMYNEIDTLGLPYNNLGVQLILPMKEVGLQYKKNKIITRDKPISGFVTFAGDISLYEKRDKFVTASVLLLDGYGTITTIKMGYWTSTDLKLLKVLEPKIELRGLIK